MHLFLTGLAGDGGIVAGADLGFVDARPNFAADQGGLQRALIGKRHRVDNLRVLVQLFLLGHHNQRLAIDRLAQHLRQQLGRRQLAGFFRQGLCQGVQVGQMNVLAVHLRQQQILLRGGRRGGGGRCLGAGRAGAESEGEAGERGEGHGRA